MNPRRSIPEDEVKSLYEIEGRVPEGTRIQSIDFEHVMIIEPDVPAYEVRIKNADS